MNVEKLHDPRDVCTERACRIVSKPQDMPPEDAIPLSDHCQQIQGHAQHVYDKPVGDQIRILVLAAGEQQDALVGILEVHSVSDPYLPEFKAISYRWEGHSELLYLPFGYVGIKKNLHDGLRSFRHRTEPVRLWADSICINQANHEERSMQVAMMGRIYGHAHEVLVWLGNATTRDTLAFWTLEFLTDFAKQHQVEYTDEAYIQLLEQLETAWNTRLRTFFFRRVMHKPGSICCSCCQELVVWREHSLTEALSALTSIWERSWFERFWVIQEVALARRAVFFCGPHHASYESLMPVSRLHDSVCDAATGTPFEIGRMHYLVSHACHILKTIIQSWRLGQLKCPRQHAVRLLLLPAGSPTSTSEPRDRVYAIRTISCLQHDRRLDPDYGLSEEDLWTRVAVALLSDIPEAQMAAAVIFGLVGTQCRPSRNALPSWVPDIPALSPESVRKYLFYANESGLQSAGGRSAKMDVVFPVTEPGVLHIRGTMFSNFAEIFKDSHRDSKGYHLNTIPSADVNKEIMNFLVPWYMECHSFAFTRSTAHHDLPDTFGQLLVHGRTLEGWCQERGGPQWERIFARLVARVRKHQPSLRDARVDTKRIPGDLSPFLTRQLYNHQIDGTRNLAVTTSGHLAWIPPSSQVGDQVCLFKGAPFPLVVRNLTEGHSHLIGDAYVHGIMHGEAWPEREENLVTFKLN